jgi:ubiquinone biosynthesis protein UbiJ
MQTKEKKTEDWKKRLNKWYGSMFECGDYEALEDFIEQEIERARQEGQKEAYKRTYDMVDAMEEIAWVDEEVQKLSEITKWLNKRLTELTK